MNAVVIDATALNHFAVAGRLQCLDRITKPWRRRVTTQAVLGELARGPHPALRAVPAATWLDVVRVDSLEELTILVEYARVLSSGERDLGEVTVLTAQLTLSWVADRAS